MHSLLIPDGIMSINFELKTLCHVLPSAKVLELLLGLHFISIGDGKGLIKCFKDSSVLIFN